MSHRAIGWIAILSVLFATGLLGISIILPKQVTPILPSVAEAPAEPVADTPAPVLMSRLPDNSDTTLEQLIAQPSPSLLPSNDAEILLPAKPIELPEAILIDVPFAPQAPFGEWHDPRQDYGCEEASLLMTWHWLQAEPLSYELARDKIIEISDWELAQTGEFHDSSASDTVSLMQNFFGHDEVSLQYNIGIDDIKQELAAGYPVLVPVDGTKLENPFYTPPGPLQHMLVVIGFDDETQEFITNDPGTKKGAKLRYSYDNLARSFRDYETGHNEPISQVRSAMIVIKPLASASDSQSSAN